MKIEFSCRGLSSITWHLAPCIGLPYTWMSVCLEQAMGQAEFRAWSNAEAASALQHFDSCISLPVRASVAVLRGALDHCNQ